MIYDRRFGLPQSIADYLNQPLPDISGIYSLPQTQIQPTLFEEDEQLESLATTGLSPEQLRLLYLQQQQGGGEGRDDDNDIDRSENLGINSLSDLSGMISTPGIIGGVLAGIPGALIGRGISNFMDPNRDIFGRLNDVGIAAQVANMAQARGLSKQAAAEAAAKGVTGFSGYGTSKQRGAAMHDAGGNNSGDHDGGASASAQGDEAAGMGGY